MKTLRSVLRIFFEGDGAGGASGAPPAATPPTTPPATPPPSPSASTPPATPPPATPPAAGGVESTPPAPTLFTEAGKANPPAAQPPADDAAMNTFVDSVKVDLGQFNGKPVELNRDAVRAIAPVALKHKLSAEVVGEIIRDYDAFERKQVEAYIAQEAKASAEAQQKVRTEFGKDLTQFLTDAQKGAKFLFGEELMGRLLNDPRYGNDVAFIKSMAQLGRMVKTDGGIGGQAAGAEKDLATRWLESSTPK